MIDNYERKINSTSKKISAVEEIRNLYKENRDINFEYRKEKFLNIFMNKPIKIATKL